MGWPSVINVNIVTPSLRSIVVLAMLACLSTCVGQVDRLFAQSDESAEVSRTIEDAQPVEGYTATVISPNVYLRSGPSFGHYPTEKIGRGQTVEVYRTASGGWVGVRPLEASFCWIPGSAVARDQDPSVAVVMGRPVEAFIGSNVEKVKRHESQVTLEPGEEIVVLGERARDGNSDDVWLKIAPPRGEFRWVHSKHLSTKTPRQLADDDARAEVAKAKKLIEGAPDAPVAATPRSGRPSPRFVEPEPRSPPDPLPESEIDEDVEQAGFREVIQNARKRVREGLFRRDKSGTAPSESSGDTGVSIGRSDSPGDDAFEIGPAEEDSQPRESTYGPDETRPFPKWSKRSSEREQEPADGVDEEVVVETPARGKIELSPKGKKPPSWVKSERSPTNVRPGDNRPDDDRPRREERTALRDNPPGPRIRPRSEFRETLDDEDALTVSPIIERGLEELDRELTIMASRDPSQWNMGVLRDYGDQLLSRSRTPLERGRVRLVLDRIAAFESTAPESGRRDDWNAPRPDAAVASRPGSRTESPGIRDQQLGRDSLLDGDPLEPPRTEPRRALAAQAPKALPVFDGSGQLMPVYDNIRKGLPPYQLVDGEGNFLRYVTPEPGVNLRRYEKKQVGLYGTRGYIESLGKDHLTARRVVEIDGLRR